MNIVKGSAAAAATADTEDIFKVKDNVCCGFDYLDHKTVTSLKNTCAC